MSDEVKSEGKDSLSEVVSIPKKVRPSKETYLKARVDYETGNYGDVKELALKYGLNYASLREKASREKWKQFDLTVSLKVSQKVAEKIENKVESFLNHLEKKGIYYEKLVEASQSQLSRNSEGIPEIDPSDLETYSRVEGRAIDWRKAALGITDKVQVSGTVSLDITGILEKIRSSQKPGLVLDVEAVERELDGVKLIEG